MIDLNMTAIKFSDIMLLLMATMLISSALKQEIVALGLFVVGFLICILVFYFLGFRSSEKINETINKEMPISSGTE